MGRELTIRLDDEMAAKLEAEAERVQQTVDDVAKEAVLRRIAEAPRVIEKKPFTVRARSMGFKPGLDFECTSRLLDELDHLVEIERAKRANEK